MGLLLSNKSAKSTTRSPLLRFSSSKLARLAAVGVILTGGVSGRMTHADAFSGTYTFGSAGDTASFAYNGTPIPNLTVGPLTKNGVTSGSSSGNFRATNWVLDTSIPNLAGSIDLSDYFEFTLTAAAGYTFNMGALNFGVGRSSTGPRQWQWRSSTDAYGNAIASYTTVNAGLTQSGGVLTNPDTNSSWTGNVLGLESSTYQTLSTITLRFYGYNSEATTGTGGLQGNFTFSGTLTAPVGTTYTWTGTGSGSTWANGQQGQFNAPYVDSGISIAEFAGSGETVTVDGAGVQAGQLDFQANGYLLAGGTLTLGLGTVTTDPAVVTAISAPIAGSNGLAKGGGGTLVLSGVNTFTGATTISAGTLEVANDSAFGSTTNDLALGGTLKTTSSISLDAGRDLSGTGTLDIAPGTTLTVNGATSMAGVTLANTGTLTFANASSNPGDITTTPTSGTVTVNGAITYTASDKVISVPTGGTLDLTGRITLTTGSGTELTKQGGGTLILSGTGSTISRVQLGRAGTNPTTGGLLRVTEAGDLGAQEMFLNSGTLEPTAPITSTIGVSFSSRASDPLVIGGAGGNAALTLGAVGVFGPSGTSGDIVVKVNNDTTFTGAVTLATGSTISGWTVGGTGQLNLAAVSTGLTAPITLADSVTLNVTGRTANAIAVGATNILTGTGTIGGAIGGAGRVQPGASPGILTAGSINPAAGTDFVLEFTGALPDYTAATASTNDVVRITAATPFSAAMTSVNTLDMFLGVTSIAIGNGFEGGFYTDTAGDFTASVSGSTLNYYVLGNGAGTDATLDGQGYYSFANWKTASGADPALALSLSTIARTATFASGTVNGQAMVVSAVPEPGTLGLAAAAVMAAAGYAVRRKKAS